MAFSTTKSGSWTLKHPRPNEPLGGGPFYERPLGMLERGFYWDSVCERTADTLQHMEVGVDPHKVKDAFGHANVSRTWINLKQQFPLLGARIEERDETNIFFVVSVENLSRCLPGEILYKDIMSAQEALDIMKNVVVKEKHLSNDLLARIFILKRTDVVNVFHIFILVAHSITDGMANITLMKTFFNGICQQNAPSPTWDLTRQLALSDYAENLHPQLRMAVARRRWRMAAAKIIHTKRMGRFATGGHTIPRRISEHTDYTPAASRALTTIFSADRTRLIISNCRRYRVTFGNTYPIIAQIATARILLKRYLRGEISEEEWDFRKKEPMTSVGPLNLRSFLDKEWIQAGGLNHICVSIGFFFYSLPMMPLGLASPLRPGAEVPPFDAMLSKKRFLLRSKLIQDQAKNSIKHPLFLEIGNVARPAREAFQKNKAFQWRKEHGPPKHLSSRILSPMEDAARRVVYNSGGSSMGNVDLLLPQKYPLQGYEKETVTPSLWFTGGTSMLHCRPTELYLGASTTRDQLRLLVYWDNNVFDEATVTEWLDEVKDAIDFYLGQDEGPQSKL